MVTSVCSISISQARGSNIILGMPTSAAMTANQSQVFSQALDYYLGDGAKHIPILYKLSKENTKEAEDTILR